jgi:mannose/fructose/N-acetylgalactosamine-specific phosphotransferase system component IIB
MERRLILSFWVLIQVTIDVLLLAGVGFLAVRISRPAKDDPRLSRGLQLLQSKISVLEDLSDRTEVQVNQLNAIMDHKIKEIQGIVNDSEKQLQQIRSSMGKSLEVAKIFQDKIPHQEIVERQNTIKYVQAARMAHQGLTPQEIAKTVNLSMGEIEFIAKINRDQLQFSDAELPDWAKEELGSAPADISVSVAPVAVEKSMSDLGAQFRSALNTTPTVAPTVVAAAPAPAAVAPAKARPLKTKAPAGEVKKAVFPKLEDLRQR